MKKRNQTTSHAPVPQSTKATDAKKKKVTVDFCIYNLCIHNLKCLRSENQFSCFNEQGEHSGSIH